MTMYAKLTPEEMNAAERAPKAGDKLPIVPVPDDATPMAFKHPSFGAPTASWAYHDAHGGLVGYVARFDHENQDGTPAKTYLPITWCAVPDKRPAWRSKGFPEPRPLYRLPEFLERPRADVMICEGEKSAEAAAVLFPELICTTPPHGAKSPSKADWTAMAGRRVVIATDADEAGLTFGDLVFDLVAEAGAAEVLHLAPEDMRQDPPQGYDIADAVADGVKAEDLRAAFRPYVDAEERERLKRVAAGEPDEIARWPFRVTKTGVEKRLERQDKDSGTITTEWRWVCSILEVTAETRDTDGEEWGRLLVLKDRDGRSKSWAMPMSLMATDGAIYRERLLSLGLVMSPGRFAREALHEYISTARPGVKARCVARVGWSAGAFVLPAETFGDFQP